MIKKIFILASTTLLFACGDPNEIVKVSKQDCSFQVVGHNKEGNSSSAIVRVNNTSKMIDINIKSGHVPDKRRSGFIKGYCVDEIAKNGNRRSYYDVKIPTEKSVGDSNSFNSF